jgi:dihydroorotase
VLDEPGLVEMLRYRAEKLHLARVLPLGALTVGLKGDVLTEMGQLTAAGCVGFSQAEVPISSTQVLQRALQYASTFGFTVWLRPQELHLGKGVAASGALATRMGLSGVSVAAETIALHTIFELVRSTRARVHLCRISSAQGVELVRQAKAEGLPVTADVSINSLHLTDVLRQQRDRDARRVGLADGTIDVLVSDHTPVDADAKALPFAEAEPGATGMELLWSLALKWGQAAALPLPQMLSRITADPARVLGTTLGSLQDSVGHLAVGGVADVCVLSTEGHWLVCDAALRSQGKSTPFSGYELPGRVRATVVGGQVAFEA